MKLKYFENKNGLEIILEPETVVEAAELMRFANNAKSEKPSIYLSFSGSEPQLNIWMRKKAEKTQYNSIRPYKS